MAEKMTIKLHAHQDQAIFAENRFVAIISGIQGGKTFAGSVWSRIQFDKFENDDGLICAPTYKILQQSTLPKFFALNKDLKRYYKKGDSVIEVPGRGKIYIRSTEDPNSLEGMTLRWCWADEAGQMKVDAWINIQGRLSILQGNCMLTTTPYFFNWLATDFYEQYKKGNKDYLVVQFQSIDNPYFPKAEFERARATMNPRVFQRRYMGLLTKLEGLVYDEFSYASDTFDPADAPKLFNANIGGIDWGFVAPAVILPIREFDNTFYILDEFYEPGHINTELKEKAAGFRDIYKVQKFYADSAEPDRIEEFNRTPRVYTVPAFKDIPIGIDKVQSLIREHRLKISRKCIHLLDEIEKYHYPPGQEGKETKELPVGVDDHAMDAMRYALATYQPTKVIRRRTDNDDGGHFRIKRHRPTGPGYSTKMA